MSCSRQGECTGHCTGVIVGESWTARRPRSVRQRTIDVDRLPISPDMYVSAPNVSRQRPTMLKESRLDPDSHESGWTNQSGRAQIAPESKQIQ